MVLSNYKINTVLEEHYKEIPNKMFKSNNESSQNMKFGINGIINQNNTCFISSSLQCILRIQPLKDYFDNKIYLKDLQLKTDEKS